MAHLNETGERNKLRVDGRSETVANSAGDKEPVIECLNLRKSYSEGLDQQLEVLRGVNLVVKPGEKIAVIGVSGSGKSTLLNMLGGLDRASSGQVIVRGRAFSQLSETETAKWRNAHLGFVYQFHHLLGEFTALENVAMPLLIAGMDKRKANLHGERILTDVGLGKRLAHKPAALSGGERQRVAIARALVTRPSCVLMDEPTGNLDPDTADNILALLLRLNKKLGISIIVVTHDRDIARQMDRILALDHGMLKELSE